MASPRAATSIRTAQMIRGFPRTWSYAGSRMNCSPGYGWVFPLGDGQVNIGVGTLATAKHPADVNLRSLIQHYTDSQRDDWQLHGDVQVPWSALLPMGGAVSGVAGRNWMLIGDAAGCVNPLNGEGIDYGLETGRLAAQILADIPVRISLKYGHTRCAPTTAPLFPSPADSQHCSHCRARCQHSDQSACARSSS
jgi:flavin-dependent dehydrogenase